MNQYGLVELPHVKNEKLYRVLVPIGVEWKDVREALQEMVNELSVHIAEYEKLEAANKAAEAAKPVEQVPVEEVVSN